MHPQIPSTIKELETGINKVKRQAKTKQVSIKTWDFMVLCEQGVSLGGLKDAINGYSEKIAQKYNLAAIAFQETISIQGRVKEPSKVIITFK